MRIRVVYQFERARLLDLIIPDTEVFQALLNPLFRFSVNTRWDSLRLLKQDGKSNIFNLPTEMFLQAVTQIADYILLRLPAHLFVTNIEGEPEVYLHIDTLFSIFAMARQKLNLTTFSEKNIKVNTPEYACLHLISFIVGLRLLQEIKSAAIPYPYKITEAQAMESFRALERRVHSGKHSEKLNMRVNTGKIAADFFTVRERNKASFIQEKNFDINKPEHSPEEIWNGEKTGYLATELRSIVFKCYKQLCDGVSRVHLKDNCLITREIISHIERDAQVGQFAPAVEHDLFKMLEKDGLLVFPKTPDGEFCGAVLDPCTGYGGRAIGALSYPGIKYYTSVDPNPGVAYAPLLMRAMYAPHKVVNVFNAKIEETDYATLTLNGTLHYQIILTSPPYGAEYYYPGQENHGDEQTLNQFMYALLCTTLALTPGGIFAINFGILGDIKKPFRHLPNILIAHLQKPEVRERFQLHFFASIPLISNAKNYLGQSSGKEYFVLAQRRAILPAIARPLQVEEERALPVPEASPSKRELPEDFYQHEPYPKRPRLFASLVEAPSTAPQSLTIVLKKGL